MRRLLAPLLLISVGATPVCAQGYCDQGSGRGPAAPWSSGYFWCSTDRAPRLATPPHWSDQLLGMAQKNSTPWGRLEFEIVIDTLGIPLRVYAPTSRFRDSALAQLLNAELMGWHFLPALHDGRRVRAYDSIQIQLPVRSRTSPPRPCLECAPRDGVTRWRVSTISPTQALCERASVILLRDSITLADEWIYQTVPRCPDGAGILARYFVTRPPPTRWEQLGRARAMMIASLASPALVEALMQSARKGHRYAFRFLPIALGLGFERATDTTAGRWNEHRQAPDAACGSIHVYLPLPGTKSRTVDRREVARVLILADSVVKDPNTPSPVRSTAWCLAGQLR